jgi:cytochrome c biogenesis protein CcmG, thiol:disulfide interchange protein DsbE
MTMSSDTPTPTRKSLRILPLALIGLGLILLGAVAFILLPKSDGASSLSEQEDRSPGTVPAAVDYPTPELNLTDLQGNPVSLTDQLGRWVLVNNWATWCPPCKAEMPALQAFYDDHHDQNFTLIAIEAGEPVEQVAEYIKKNNLRFTVWPDPQQKVYDAFHNPALPTSWVIDPRGQVRLTWSGAISREMLEKYITPLLEE